MSNAELDAIDEVAEPKVVGTTLEQAEQLLTKIPGPVLNDFKRIRAAAPRGPSDRELLLKEYLACVVNNPKEWLATLPDSWKSFSGLGKGKIVLEALMKVCTKDGVCPDIYPDVWADVKEALASMDKKMMREEIEVRKAEKAADDEEATAETEIIANEDVTWRLRLRRICINYCHLTDNAPAKDLLQHAWEEGTKLESMETLQRIYHMLTSGAPLHSVLDVIVVAQDRCSLEQ